MSESILREYGFRKRSQWAAGLRQGFELAADDSLQAAKFFASKPTHISRCGPVSVITAASGVTWWRTSEFLHQREEGGDEATFEIDGLLASSERWVSDREYIWCFDEYRVGRVRRTNLHADLDFDAV